jgi:hypothetical protein
MNEVEPLTTRAFQGLSSASFTYGVTGSGKTHSMIGKEQVCSCNIYLYLLIFFNFRKLYYPTYPNPPAAHHFYMQDMGMAPRAVRSLLLKLAGLGNERSLCMSLFDVTSDGVIDLLEPKPLLTEDDNGIVSAQITRINSIHPCIRCFPIILKRGLPSRTAQFKSSGVQKATAFGCGSSFVCRKLTAGSLTYPSEKVRLWRADCLPASVCYLVTVTLKFLDPTNKDVNTRSAVHRLQLEPARTMTETLKTSLMARLIVI